MGQYLTSKQKNDSNIITFVNIFYSWFYGFNGLLPPRHSGRLHLPRVRREIGQRGFSYFGPALYSGIPDIFKHCNSSANKKNERYYFLVSLIHFVNGFISVAWVIFVKKVKPLNNKRHTYLLEETPYTIPTPP